MVPNGHNTLGMPDRLLVGFKAQTLGTESYATTPYSLGCMITLRQMMMSNL